MVPTVKAKETPSRNTEIQTVNSMIGVDFAPEATVRHINVERVAPKTAAYLTLWKTSFVTAQKTGLFIFLVLGMTLLSKIMAIMSVGKT